MEGKGRWRSGETGEGGSVVVVLVMRKDRCWGFHWQPNAVEKLKWWCLCVCMSVCLHVCVCLRFAHVQLYQSDKEIRDKGTGTVIKGKRERKGGKMKKYKERRKCKTTRKIREKKLNYDD